MRKCIFLLALTEIPWELMNFPSEYPSLRYRELLISDYSRPRSGLCGARRDLGESDITGFCKLSLWIICQQHRGSARDEKDEKFLRGLIKSCDWQRACARAGIAVRVAAGKIYYEWEILPFRKIRERKGRGGAYSCASARIFFILLSDGESTTTVARAALLRVRKVEEAELIESEREYKHFEWRALVADVLS